MMGYTYRKLGQYRGCVQQDLGAASGPSGADVMRAALIRLHANEGGAWVGMRGGHGPSVGPFDAPVTWSARISARPERSVWPSDTISGTSSAR